MSQRANHVLGSLGLRLGAAAPVGARAGRPSRNHPVGLVRGGALRVALAAAADLSPVVRVSLRAFEEQRRVLLLGRRPVDVVAQAPAAAEAPEEAAAGRLSRRLVHGERLCARESEARRDHRGGDGHEQRRQGRDRAGGRRRAERVFVAHAVDL